MLELNYSEVVYKFSPVRNQMGERVNVENLPALLSFFLFFSGPGPRDGQKIGQTDKKEDKFSM